MTGAEFSEVDIDLLADYVGGVLDGTPDEAVVTALITEDATWRDAHARLSAGVATVTGQLRALGSVAEPMPADIFARLDAALLGAAGAGRATGAPTATGAASTTGADKAIGAERTTDAERATRAEAIGAERAADATRAAGNETATGNESIVTDPEVVGRATRATRIASIEDVSSDAAVGPAAMEPGSDGAAPARHLVAVPSGSRSKRARRLRWAAPVGIAAGVLAFAGFGFQQQFAGGSSEDAASSAGNAEAAAAPQVAADSELTLPGGSARIVESGTDYRLATLGVSAGRARTASDLPPDQLDPMSKAAPSPGMITAVDPLDRLRVQGALRACIEAIAAQHGAGEIVPQTIDFARFDGAPAVIVEFTAAGGGSWVWASGPACGTPGVGAAKLGSVKVG